MRKIFLVFGFCFCLALHAQVQRLILVEEFASASSGPCAAVNPAFNQLLIGNQTKVVPVKYELALPGNDPMYAQDSTDSNDRRAYYGNPTIPYALTDGSPVVNDCPSSYFGYPGCLSQQEIDSMYGIPAPFSMSMAQTLNATRDSIYLGITITAAQNISLVSPKLRISMREEVIKFFIPPGGTAEKKFYMVNREMVPDANGISLPLTWNNGQSQSYNFTVAIPVFIYNRNQLAFAAWIQEDATKEVLQADTTGMLPDIFDAALTNVAGIPAASCTIPASLSPVVTLTNDGDSTLTSCDIYYETDNASPQVYHWTGTLLPGGSTPVALTLSSPVNGIEHHFRATVSAPNGTIDFNNADNTIVFSFTAPANSAATIPYSEGFENAFPPAGTSFDNDDSLIGWAQDSVGGFGNSPHCASVDFWNYRPTLAQKDYLYLPLFDLSAAPSPLYLDFSVAYMTYINPVTQAHTHDSLLVQVSTDCGLTWNTLYGKTDTVLATVPGSGFDFRPAPAQWRRDTIDLSSYATLPDVAIRFKTSNDFGNPVYLDDIHLDSPLGIKDPDAQAGVCIYPNPAGEKITIVSSTKISDGRVLIYNNAGQEVLAQSLGAEKTEIDVQMLPPGIYFYFITTGETTVGRGKLAVE